MRVIRVTNRGRHRPLGRLLVRAQITGEVVANKAVRHILRRGFQRSSSILDSLMKTLMSAPRLLEAVLVAIPRRGKSKLNASTHKMKIQY